MAPRNEPSEDWQVNYPKIQMRSAHLLNSRKWTDCTFMIQTSAAAAGDLKISLDAHKLILAMASPVLAAMFYGNVGDRESPVIISDIDLPTFTALLKYIYTDKADISDAETAISLYKAANKYILVHLEKMCVDYLFAYLNPNNVCHIYEFACFFGKNILKEKCIEVISTKTQDVLKGCSFRIANIATVKKIVSMDSLYINSEFELYNALLDYVDNLKNPDNSRNLEIQSSRVNMEHEKSNNITSDVGNNSGSSENKDLPLSTKEPTDAREILHDCIKEIRFLSMTPAELAKICESTTILSDHEIRALFTNMFMPNSSIIMPDGFSCIREPRIRFTATFQHTVHNVTSMIIKQKVYSPPFYVCKLPWRILTMKKTEMALGFFIECNADSLPAVSEDWSCNAEFELRLLSANPNNEPKLTTLQHEFSKKSCDWGNACFIKWSQLIDPENNYIKDDSITLEVHLSTKPVQVIDFK